MLLVGSRHLYHLVELGPRDGKIPNCTAWKYIRNVNWLLRGAERSGDGKAIGAKKTAD
jgi:hypothetical protein